MPSAVKKGLKSPMKKVKVTKEAPILPEPETDSKDDFMSKSNLAQMSSSISALLKVIGQEKTIQKKKSLFKDDPKEIILQILPIKIPVMKAKHIRMLLPHTVAIENSDVCLITENVKNSTRENHEPTINHYKNFLKDQRIVGVTQIVPIRQLLSEYTSFEMKSRFGDMYDRVLVDNRLYGKVTKFLGSSFFKKNKDLIPVKLNTSKIKERVERCLKVSVLTVHGKGDSFAMKVGFSHFSTEQLKENICTVARTMFTEFPGGFNNVRRLLIKSRNSLAIPVWISLRSPNSVEVPVVQERLPKAHVPVSGELTTMVGGHVKVMPTGEVIFRKKYVQEDVDMGFAKSTKEPVSREYESCLNEDEFDDDFEVEDSEDEEEGGEDDNAMEVERKKNKKNSKSKAAGADESSDDDVEAAEDAYLEDLELGMKQTNEKKGHDKAAPKLKQKRGKKGKKTSDGVEIVKKGQSKKNEKKQDKPAQEIVSGSMTPKQKKRKLNESGLVEEETPRKQKNETKKQKGKQSQELVAESPEPNKKKMKPNGNVGENTSLNVSKNYVSSPVVKDKVNKNAVKLLKKQKMKNKGNKSLNAISSTSIQMSPEKTLTNSEGIKKNKKKKNKKSRLSDLSQ